MTRPIINGDRRTYFPTPDAYERMLTQVPHMLTFGSQWPDAKTPKTDRPMLFGVNFSGGMYDRPLAFTYCEPRPSPLPPHGGTP